MTPEGKVKAEGRKVCKDLGIYFFPVNQGGFGKTGIPDDALCVRGRFIHIEYKAHMRWDKRNKTAFSTLPTDRQVLMMEKARQAGAMTWVIDDTNIDELRPALKHILQSVYINTEYPISWWWSYKEFTNYKAGLGSLRIPYIGYNPTYIEV